MAGEKPPCTGTVRAHPDRDAAIALPCARAHSRARARSCAAVAEGRDRLPHRRRVRHHERVGRSVVDCVEVPAEGDADGRGASVSGAVRAIAPRSALPRATHHMPTPSHPLAFAIEYFVLNDFGSSYQTCEVTPSLSTKLKKGACSVSL